MSAPPGDGPPAAADPTPTDAPGRRNGAPPEEGAAAGTEPHRGLLEALIDGSHLAVPDDVPALLVRHGVLLGALDVGLYLADLEQQTLRPVPNPAGSTRDPVDIDATLAGRCFQRIEIERSDPVDGRVSAWIPVLDGTERLGVLEVVLPAGQIAPPITALTAFGGLVAELVVTKANYGDLFEKVRRTRPLSAAAELLWQLLPPLTFANNELVIAAAFAPPYDLGGDAFDYAVDAHTARLAIFDALGHGLSSGLLATLVLATYRNCRRLDMPLEATVEAIDAAIAAQYTDSSFVTGVVAELDISSGELRYCVAGHPRPLLLRNGRIVKELRNVVNRPPLGLRSGPWEPAHETLEPDDRVILFSDGVTEARREGGQFLGDARLADLIVRASGAGAPPPETLRRLLRSILDHQEGELQDDATVVILEWRGPGPDRLDIDGPPHLAPRP
ncbi:PP2C family protein-serine/threonine phosphatase [Dermatobacter hominis]|uniref:PP2C family protein-serine/threonine phosphatase n=1 Tax=Dermatobacter hominis TaxID=2884263 RepID=UPI001D1238BF|nr:PP2C family protein-serine/threonine phosphatase [Dermatobacter hominis]UDY36729.1 serine/threonine-protein phosphatase [Dermatobacter hominis]